MGFNKQSDEEQQETEEISTAQLIALAEQQGGIELRTFGLCGDIDEEKTAEILYTILALKESGRKETLVDPNDVNSEVETTYEPFDFLISTAGGSAYEMFGIYDLMRQVRSDCVIRTIGMGKVMSAGVVLLAAGTKGQRYIGENCRVMIHSVAGGHAGSLHNLEAEMDEIRWCQEQYVNALAKETSMTKPQIKKLLAKKINIYLNAQEAIKYGIADIII